MRGKSDQFIGRRQLHSAGFPIGHFKISTHKAGNKAVPLKSNKVQQMRHLANENTLLVRRK